ncbi:MAG TPA: alginate lyase family protein [Candidatus Hydrogenedentes bacterium]|nr:alginate lyase family protein [Candidatus Hydrogenedentota bacterium]HOV74162.1 alginate lyase family protein [Candidatus Hydrogenedentota bacterium]HPC15701.1 alginate lyase family protein [Candidatus Hydrogenedentota bacterium]HRT19675.1 alginate lyase family protein [Candidatus Hydrogenedentota bacterium]HRT64449.1 alginate lyase family protein [Candidatus Hydrogenedentota bacterium]
MTERQAMHNPGRFLRTVRWLKPKQAAWRAWYLARRRAGIRPRVAQTSPVASFDAGALDRLRDFLRTAEEKAPAGETILAALRAGHLKALNAEATGAWDWDRLAQSPRPGRSAVHWFEYVRPLAQVGACGRNEADDARRVMTWIHDWIARHPPGARDAWDAYPIATRLMNWALAFAAFGPPDPAVLDSWAAQARWLSRSIEYDVEANHLVRDAQGLIVAGALMAASPEGQRWIDKGLRLLARTLAEQILDDGGHYERSAMYHAHVLEGNLIAHAAIQMKPPFLRDAISRMADFLPRVTHPDGEIPLFGDAALGTCMPPLALHSTASAICGHGAPPIADGADALEPSGFYVMRTAHGAAWMIAKAAPVEPSYQPGHAHADPFSYELSVAGRRIVVDSGNPVYEANPMRAYCRSVRAHNTVAVDRREPMECWDVFRIGRRYRLLSREWSAAAYGWRLVASHDGFAPFRHTREIHFIFGGAWLIGDRVDGPRPCEAESFIHFHPDVWLEPRGDGYVAAAGSGETLIRPFGVSSVEHVHGVENPLQGWHCPRFGEAHPADCLVLYARGRNVRFGYTIAPPCAGEETRRILAECRERFLDKGRW